VTEAAVGIANAQEVFVQVNDFLEGLRQAALGVVRVVHGPNPPDSAGRPLSTGWLITDSLVVFPNFAASLAKSFRCCPSSAPDRAIDTDLLADVVAQQSGVSPVLLRLHEPLPGCALTLQDRWVVEGEAVFIVQYPQGRPRAHLSYGRLFASQGPWLRYNANTEVGSAGAPIFDISGKVAGMHCRGGPQFNEGLALAAILDGLRASAAWEEIAQHHRLANVSAGLRVLEASASAPGPPAIDGDLVRAALLWSFDPELFPKAKRELLRPLVIQPTATRWALRVEERQRLIGSKSLSELKQARGNELATEPGQRTIDRILEGPPYLLADVNEEDLPFWLQAVRWFAGAAKGLPTPAEVNRELARRRVRSRLRRIVGPTFRGRADELGELKSWFGRDRPGPMVLTGIGGVGKSALVARFAEGLPATTPLLWLDFDRADLAPDDPVSVLNVLAEQATLQLDDFSAPPVDASTWPESAGTFGDELARVSAGRGPPLLVLDGFEVAQHAKEHHKIWRLLELILKQAPDLCVLVAGRAPVPKVELGGRVAHSRRLGGMSRADAAAWLRERGIDGPVLERVLDISDCVPLALKFAVRLLEEGGKLEELPKLLSGKLIEGVLYRRILDRVLDPILNEIARDALVLRRLTPDMLAAVLGDRVPRGLDAHEVFARLTRELALVDGGDEGLAVTPDASALRLRPEVRAAALRLLEMDDPKRVRSIDERATAWYAAQNAEDVANAAELVYHRLRLGDIDGAALAWRDGCAWRLLFAEEELPESPPVPREWLRKRLEQDQLRPVGVAEWEQVAAVNIRSALERGVLHVVSEVLAGRPERGPASPLFLYDAWSRWQAGDLPGARALLAGAPRTDGTVGRDRAVFAALLASRAEDRREADGLLEAVQGPGSWGDRRDGSLFALAVQAARARLTIDPKAEMVLGRGIDAIDARLGSWEGLRRALSPMDVVLPSLVRRFARGDVGLESLQLGPTIQVPAGPQTSPQFLNDVERVRYSTFMAPPLLDLPLAPDFDAWQSSELPKDLPSTGIPSELGANLRLCLDLTVLGWRRWRLMATTSFLAEASEFVKRGDANDPLALAVLGTLGVFCEGEPEAYSLSYQSESLGSIFARAFPKPNLSFPCPEPPRASLALEALLYEAGTNAKVLADWLERAAAGGGPGQSIVGWLPVQLIDQLDRPDLRPLCLYLLGPDPLEQLARRVLGLPDSLALSPGPRAAPPAPAISEVAEVDAMPAPGIRPSPEGGAGDRPDFSSANAGLVKVGTSLAPVAVPLDQAAVATWTVPLQMTVSLRAPTLARAAAEAEAPHVSVSYAYPDSREPGGRLGHPFFDTPRYPWWREPEAVELHRVLYQSIQAPAQIDTYYQRCGGGLPPLALVGQPPNLIWREALTNLTVAGVLRRLCEALRNEAALQSRAIQNALQAVFDAQPTT
jgi:hypothetical protein